MRKLWVAAISVAGVVVSLSASAADFSVSMSPGGSDIPARDPMTITLDAGYMAERFRQVDVFVNDLQSMRFTGHRTRIDNVLMPPGAYRLRFEAVDQGWMRDREARALRIEDPDFAPPSALEGFEAFSVQKWNDAYLARYGLSAAPFETYDASWTGHELFGNVGYWVRAYTVMAKLTGSRYYIDKAGLLVHLMLESSDARRAERGELSLAAAPYGEAPDPFLRDRTLPAPGWRNPYTNSDGRTITRIEALVDGHIAHHIMTYVDLVLSDERFAAHKPFANQVLVRVMEIIDSHDSMWADDAQAKVPGSYYYSDGKGGKWAPPAVFNHSAVLLSAALLVNRHAPNQTYRDRAGRLVRYFMSHVQEKDGGYLWDYDPFTPDRNGPALQDVVHGAMDLQFLVLAREAGLGGLTDADMRKFAKTFKSKTVAQGNIAFRIDGQELNPQSWVIDSVALGWLDLARYDPSVFATVLSLYARHKAAPGWERSFLGWAKLMDTYVRLQTK